MFEKLTQQIAGKMLRHALRQLADGVEPSCFGDPLAERTCWNPLKSGGANFRTHKLVSVQRDRMEFRITAGMLLFALAFFLVGVGAGAGALLAAELSLPLALFGSIFLAIGVGLFYFSSKPVVFDKRKGLFWKGWKSPDDVADLSSIKCCVRLGEIHALQIVAEQLKSKNSSYSSYELNLVLKDASRINVVLIKTFQCAQKQLWHGCRSIHSRAATASKLFAAAACSAFCCSITACFSFCRSCCQPDSHETRFLRLIRGARTQERPRFALFGGCAGRCSGTALHLAGICCSGLDG